MLPIDAIRRQFPALPKKGAYLDAAATAQKPRAVIDAMTRFMETDYANVHRGVHVSSEKATLAYESARSNVQKFLHAAHSDEIIFTKNATESINLVARTFGETLKKGDTVALSLLEHHSNIVPWLQLKERCGIKIVWIELTESGEIDQTQYEALFAKHTIALVALTGLSNVLGVMPPLKKMIDIAHKHGSLILIDGAQHAAHCPVDVQDLDCDFYAFSGHKVYGPTGIGVLFGRRALLKKLPPFLGGGMMISDVKKDAFAAADSPQKFEAGTPPIVEAIGLHAALEWLSSFSIADREEHEKQLLARALVELQKVPGLRILGPANVDRIHSCISFVVEGVHAHDLSDELSTKGFHLRAGHQCTQPLHEHLGLTASTRLSVGIYNTEEEITDCIAALKEVIDTLR